MNLQTLPYLKDRAKKYFPLEKTTGSKPVSLSDFFPTDTIYFYGYPSGEDSNFFNNVPPVIEEVVAGRPLCIAGDNIKILTFNASLDPSVWNILKNDLHLDLIDKNNIITLPEEITAYTEGNKRNDY